MTEAIDLIEQIAMLRAENARLKEQAAKKAKPKNVLLNVPNPNPAEFVSAESVAKMLVDSKILPKAESTDVRSFLKFFGLKAIAQCKADGEKGRGKLLFTTPDIAKAISYLQKFGK